MNVKRFAARNSRDALKLVREAFGDDAVVVSTRPCAEGVEMLAMPAGSLREFERVSAPASASASSSAAAGSLRERAAAQHPAQDPAPGYEQAESALENTSPQQDAERLAMSTLSFQDYVRERMLRRRQAELRGEPLPEPDVASARPAAPRASAQRVSASPKDTSPQPASRGARHGHDAAAPAAHSSASSGAQPAQAASTYRAVPRRIASVGAMLQEADVEIEAGYRSEHRSEGHSPELAEALQERAEMMTELRSMKGLIEERFSTLAFLERMQRHPARATLAQKLLDCGFSPSLVRKLTDNVPEEGDVQAWATRMLEGNLRTGEREDALEDAGGVYALIGTTGVGKTTSTAKLAAAFAARHGAANLGLITLDAYRVGAHEQLRAYGRILGVPVHIAHDRASLEDLLELLSSKRMVLIDTAGMAQRDARTRELLEMLSHPSIRKILVINAAAQGETIEDVVQSYRAARCQGVVLSKVDEAVKIGPALDAVIRHKLKVLAVGNGQRVPEDWHRLSAVTLVQRALCVVGSAAWRIDASELNLVFAGSVTAPVEAAASAVPGSAMRARLARQGSPGTQGLSGSPGAAR